MDRLRVLVGIGVLTQLSLFVVFLYAYRPAHQGAPMTFTYFLALSAVTIFDWNRQVGPFWVRTGLGWLSGSMVIVSVILPWRVVGTYSFSLVDPGYESWFVPQLILTGGVASILTRYGGLVTLAGLWRFLSIPSFCTLDGCPPLVLGLGFWLAFTGVGLSMFGRTLNLPFKPWKLQRLLEVREHKEDIPSKPAGTIEGGEVAGEESYKKILQELDCMRKKWR